MSDWFDPETECLRCFGTGIEIVFSHRYGQCHICDHETEIKDLIKCPICNGTGKKKEEG